MFVHRPQKDALGSELATLGPQVNPDRRPARRPNAVANAEHNALGSAPISRWSAGVKSRRPQAAGNTLDQQGHFNSS